MTKARPLFSAFGIEIEYMIVDRETLAVRPIADKLLAAAAIFPGPLSRAAEVAALPEPIRVLAPMSVRGINYYP